uniref:Uncharacterized protein n=1 Tax=Lepisosteus oculatus TaxID=7918 RepID=W5M1B1_LEPOC
MIVNDAAWSNRLRLFPRAFETQMTRLEAEFVRREAPPSYGQLIAQGLIPPVEDFPVYNPSQASVLQNIRTAMRRQIRRHSSRRAASRRRLGRIWSRLFHRGTRLRGQIPLLTPPGAPHPPLGGGAHSYQAVAGSERQAPSPCSPPASEGPTGGLSPASEDLEGGACSRCRGPGSPPAPGEAERGLCPRKVSRKLVQGLAANLRGVSVRHYSSLDPPPPAQPRAEPPPAGPSGCRSVEVPILEDAGGLGGGRRPSSDEDDDESLLVC